MKLSIQQVKDIINTLPIGYYLGRNIKVHVDSESEVSFYDPIHEEIELSYKRLDYAISKISSSESQNIETLLRSLLYHEVSHAMLTPKILSKTFNRALNIVEDERIEQITEDYFLDIDYKLTIDLMNNLKESADTPINKFYDVVRYKKGPEVFVNKAQEIINKYKFLTRSSKECAQAYNQEVRDLYDRFIEYLAAEESTDSDEWTKMKTINDIVDKLLQPATFSENNIKDSWDFKSNGNQSLESAENRELNKGQSLLKVDRDLFDSITSKYVNEDLIRQLIDIFSQSSKIEKYNSCAINSYSGVFDPRSVVREDYKYFLTKNRQGTSRAYSRIHLNLFLDRSGSFIDNVQKANEIIYALSRIEKNFSDFDFTLITMGMGEDIQDRNDYEHSAYDGTCISSEIFNTFKKVQVKSAINYNIVLYDGVFFYQGAKKKDNGRIENFSAFNTPNTLIIIDPSCKEAIEYVPSAKVIICDNYTEELIKNLIKLLKQIVR